MSSHQHPKRALAALAVLSLSALLACASGGAAGAGAGQTRSARDSVAANNVGNTDGRSVEDLFAGRFPGVVVTRVEGGGLHIRVRGGGSNIGNDAPLYVVDDVPMSTGNRGVVFLNPSDIAKIEVLKNPADVAIYGVRGANGVIKITTKNSGGRR